MKAQAILEGMDPLVPGDCFLCHVAIGRDFTPIPDLSSLLGEECGAEFALAWQDEGIRGRVVVHKPLFASSFPDYDKGDAIEVFFDTRDNKKAGVASRFCHQFIFMPGEVEGGKGREVTRFRLDDTHPLCDPSLLQVEVMSEKKRYILSFFIPKEAFCGYDPQQFDRLGFAYKIHRHGQDPLHFPFSSRHFVPLHHPSLWARLSLKRGD